MVAKKPKKKTLLRFLPHLAFQPTPHMFQLFATLHLRKATRHLKEKLAVVKHR